MPRFSTIRPPSQASRRVLLLLGVLSLFAAAPTATKVPAFYGGYALMAIPAAIFIKRFSYKKDPFWILNY